MLLGRLIDDERCLFYESLTIPRDEKATKNRLDESISERRDERFEKEKVETITRKRAKTGKEGNTRKTFQSSSRRTTHRRVASFLSSLVSFPPSGRNEGEQ